MLKIIIIFFIFFINFILSLPNIFIKEDQNYNLNIDIYLGTDKQYFSLILDNNFISIWVNNVNNDMQIDRKYNNESSKESKLLENNIEIQYENKKLYCDLISDNFYLNNNNNNEQILKNFNFLSISKIDYSYDKFEGYFGLGYTINSDEKKYSLIHQLYENNIISKKLYSINFISNTEGEISFNIPSEIINSKDHLGSCGLTVPIIKNNFYSTWQCNINGLLFGIKKNSDKILYYNEKNIIFSYKDKKTLFPINLLIQLEKEYFGNLIESGDCNFGVKNDKLTKKLFYTFTCHSDSYNIMKEKLNDLSFIIGDYAIYFPFEELFIYDDVDKEYEFVFYGKENEDNFILSSYHLKHLFMIFDYEETNIKFYNKKYVFNLNNGAPEKEKENEEKNNDKNDDEKDWEKKENENKFVPEENDDEDVVVNEKKGFKYYLFKFISKLFIILLIIVIIFFIFRYYRRKKYSDPSFFYKATEELFDDGEMLRENN